MSYCSCCDDDYEVGYREAQENVVRAVLEELHKRRLGAALPLAIYSDVMTLDEVEKMIREVGK